MGFSEIDDQLTNSKSSRLRRRHDVNNTKPSSHASLCGAPFPRAPVKTPHRLLSIATVSISSIYMVSFNIYY